MRFHDLHLQELTKLLVPGVDVDPNVVKQRLGHAIVEDFVKHIGDN